MATKRYYGYLPDFNDHRDIPYTALKPPRVLPASVARLGLGYPIDDQGQLGSCTGNATERALRILMKTPADYSRLMLYYNGRALEGTTSYDSGCMIRDVIKGLATYGACAEVEWPYNIAEFTLRPPQKCYIDGSAIRTHIKQYQRVTTLGGLRTALSEGIPVIFGFSVPDYFEGDTVATTGWVPYPTPSDAIIGGHAVLAVGYDATGHGAAIQPGSPYVWVANSWGTGWGVGGSGYFQMPFAWFNSPLVSDMWALIGA